MSLVHGRTGFHVLSRSTLDYICGQEIADIVVPVEEVGDIQVNELIDKVLRIF